MSKPDLDALEKLLVTEAADPFAFVEAAPSLLAMARRTERLETELHNYETNHGARCDAEQERYATIAESACRVIAGAVDRLREMMRIDVGDDLSEAVAGLLRDLSAHASAPGHEVPGLRAKLAARDAALGACAARIAELLAQVGAWKQAAQQVVDLFDPLKARATIPHDAVIIATAAKQAHLDVRSERDRLRARAAELERQVTASVRAIGAVLDRIQGDPDVRYLLGPGSDVFGRLVDAEAAITGDDTEAVAATRAVARPPVSEPEVLRLRRLVGEREARAAEAERDRDEARAKVEEARALADGILKALHLADKTSDGYRDAHAAFQRWAAKLAPDAIGDEQKRAAIDARLARPPLDPAHVAVLRGMLGKLHESAIAVERGIESGRHLDALDNMREASAAIKREVAALEAVLGEGVRS